jgi:DNA repair photolyase
MADSDKDCELWPRRFKGRGAGLNPDARYLASERSAIDDGWTTADPEPAPLLTRVQQERSQSILSFNNSPDLPFDRSINAFRGCEHGCIYCYARPAHAYMDLSPGLDFESRLFVKPDAARLLREALDRPSYRPGVIALGTNTDPYQPIERRYRITRAILEVLSEYQHPVSIVTKSALVERDFDLLVPMAAQGLAEVQVSVTTLSRELSRRLEPRAAAPERRLLTLGRLHAAGIPCGVMFAPVIPAVNDAELEQVLAAARDAGAARAGYGMLRLPREVAALFEEWLDHHLPERKNKVLAILRELRAGALNSTDFATRQSGVGVYARLIAERFRLALQRSGFEARLPQLDLTRFRRPARSSPQLDLFGMD